MTLKFNFSRKGTLLPENLCRMWACTKIEGWKSVLIVFLPLFYFFNWPLFLFSPHITHCIFNFFYITCLVEGQHVSPEMSADIAAFLCTLLPFSHLPLSLCPQSCFSPPFFLPSVSHKLRKHTHRRTERNICLWCNENIYPQESPNGLSRVCVWADEVKVI